jgi:hypothetical protein
MNDLPLVATVTSLVSAAISSARNARDIAKDSSDHALKSAISDLYDSLLDVKDRALQIDEENRLLRLQLSEKAQYTGPAEPFGYYFFADNDIQPLCPKCFQEAPRRIGLMSKLESWNRGQRRRCQLCGFQVYEVPMNLNPGRISPVRSEYT